MIHSDPVNRSTVFIYTIVKSSTLFLAPWHPSVKSLKKVLGSNYNIRVTTRTLTRRLQVWGFTESTLLPTLHAIIEQLFRHHILTNKEIIRVLHGEGYLLYDQLTLLVSIANVEAFNWPQSLLTDAEQITRT